MWYDYGSKQVAQQPVKVNVDGTELIEMYDIK